MSLFSFRKPKVLTTLQEQGGGLVGDVRQAASQAVSHVGSLWALFRIELAEYASQQTRRVALFVAAGVLLVVSYALLCAFVCVALNLWLESWLWAVGIVLLVNALAGVIILLSALRAKPAPLAEVTRQELKNDLECLKILLSEENTKS